ncbi:hypothetical protein ACHAXR_006121 [Thalassiosira sp. AJA248-18]
MGKNSAQKSETSRSPMCNDTTPPITQSISSLTAADTRIVPPTNKYPEPINVGSLDHSAFHREAKYETGSVGFQKSKGRTAASNIKCSTNNNSSGRWTTAEHEAFLQGLKVYGREWKKVATCIPTRTSAQIRSHAQKYFAKVSKEQQQLLVLAEKRRLSFPDCIPSTDASLLHNAQPMSQSFADTMNSIMENPSEVESRVCKTLASLRERYKQLEDQLQQIQAPASTDESALGPATAALDLEQKSLRRAAEARYEMKKLENQHKKQPASIATGTTGPACARVSIASMPSQGGFDSSDVIALSMLGGNLCREKIENRTKSIIKDEQCLKIVRERLQPIEHKRPAKLRKVDED